MTIPYDSITLWDNGIDKIALFSVPSESQYRYESGQPCVTVGFAYENKAFRGCDTFTLFGRFYLEFLDAMRQTRQSLNGGFRLYDAGADTDGFVDFRMKNGRLHAAGRLGASFSTHSLTFEFDADQTLLEPFLDSLTLPGL